MSAEILIGQWIERERVLRAQSRAQSRFQARANEVARCRRELQEALGLVLTDAEVRDLAPKNPENENGTQPAT